MRLSRFHTTHASRLVRALLTAVLMLGCYFVSSMGSSPHIIATVLQSKVMEQLKNLFNGRLSL